MVNSTYNVPALAGCDDFGMPTVDLASCIKDIQHEFSRITDIYMVEPKQGSSIEAAVIPPDNATAQDWAAILGQTGAERIRRLAGVGDLPKPAQVKGELNGNEATSALDFTLNFSHNHISATNYELLRLLQNSELFIWFKTAGGFLYGGRSGIKCEVSQASHVLANGKDSVTVHEYEFKWRHKNYPDRVVSPI